MSNNPEWHTFVEWTETVGEDSFELLVASVDDCVLTVRYRDQPFNSCPKPAWHWTFEYKGVVASSGFALNPDTGRKDCMRTAVKMAAAHGMPLPPRVQRAVAGVLLDPFGVPDPDRPGHRKAARRVVIDGHSPAKLAKHARATAPAPNSDPALEIADE